MAAIEYCSTCKCGEIDPTGNIRCHRHPPTTYSPLEKMFSTTEIEPRSYVWPTVDPSGYCQFWNNKQHKHIAGAGTFVVMPSPGHLFNVVLNKNTGTSITIYDNVSATGEPLAVLGTITQASLDYDCPLSNGLTIVTVGPVDITVMYQ